MTVFREQDASLSTIATDETESSLRPVPEAYSVWLISPPRYPHARALEEVALALVAGFRELGISAPLVRDQRQVRGRPVILGANFIREESPPRLPPGSILYNLEQISPGSPWLTPEYLELLSRYPVWDYSETNIAALRALGIGDVTHCGLGYAETLTRIAAAEEDIDVLFYGSLNDRRRQVLVALRAAGLRAGAVFGKYGPERDALIARARILLNVHFYPAKVFEIVRVSYLLANRRFVISETSPVDQIVRRLEGGVVFADYPDLVACCLGYLQRPRQRRRIAERGFARFRRHRQSEYLRRALGLDAAAH